MTRTFHGSRPRAVLCFPCVESRRTQIPTGLYKVASWCAGKYDVAIIDQRLAEDGDLETLASIINHENPICLGLSVITGQQVATAARISERFHDVLPIVWGGPHPTLFPIETLATGLVDFVIVGEGEQAFLDLLDYLAERPYEQVEFPGGPNGDFGYHVFAGFADVVDTYWDRADIPADYLVKRDGFERAVSLETSRGCPHKCGFCHNAARPASYRAKPANVVTASIQSAFDAVKMDGVVFQEDNFFAKKQRAVEIMRFVMGFDTVGWKANARINYFTGYVEDRGFMQELVDSGCAVLQFGVESGSQRMLDAINKGICVDQVLAVNRGLAAYPIRVRYNFIVGFPDETDSDCDATLSLIEQLRADNPHVEPPFVNTYSPYPGTPLYTRAVELGFREPQNPHGWANLSWHSTEQLPWLSAEQKARLRRLSDRFFSSSRYLQ
jgi:anaerobic magnesium-protoporphyrin IX monomethyl ester cyclase